VSATSGVDYFDVTAMCGAFGLNPDEEIPQLQRLAKIVWFIDPEGTVNARSSNYDLSSSTNPNSGSVNTTVFPNATICGIAWEGNQTFTYDSGIVVGQTASLSTVSVAEGFIQQSAAGAIQASGTLSSGNAWGAIVAAIY
jgi:hypothetical protein